ncbi:hypothetical protein YPPY88_1386, partial [Yersinia pestis PY-88]
MNSLEESYYVRSG